MIISWYYYLIIFNPTRSQSIYESLFDLSSSGTQYSPANQPAQFISSVSVNSQKLCAVQCHMNVFCRIFDHGAIQSNECRLFEGDIGILGNITSSSMSDSIVGTLKMSPSLFSQYGAPCSSVCVGSRYLVCGTGSVCECLPHSYWNASVGMCLAQMTIADVFCDSLLTMCRVDIGLICTTTNQCGCK
jgi:hypothetical protein